MCLVSVETLLDAIKHNNIMSVQLWRLILAAEKQDVCSLTRFQEEERGQSILWNLPNKHLKHEPAVGRYG